MDVDGTFNDHIDIAKEAPKLKLLYPNGSFMFPRTTVYEIMYDCALLVKWAN